MATDIALELSQYLGTESENEAMYDANHLVR
jgi:hypothetical protein